MDSQSEPADNFISDMVHKDIMSNESTMIIQRLDEIKTELDFIKEHLVDVDSILTDDDLSALDEAEQDFKHGKTKRL